MKRSSGKTFKITFLSACTWLCNALTLVVTKNFSERILTNMKKSVSLEIKCAPNVASRSSRMKKARIFLMTVSRQLKCILKKWKQQSLNWDTKSVNWKNKWLMYQAKTANMYVSPLTSLSYQWFNSAQSLVGLNHTAVSSTKCPS